MTERGRWCRRGSLPSLGLLLLLGTGCLSFTHPVKGPPIEDTQIVGLPRECRNHLYIFFVHGLDPLDCGNLYGVRDYLISLGYIKTYLGQLYHGGTFEKEIRRLHEEDPQAHFALVGFSLGANVARDIACAMRSDHITIDLLLYVGGNSLGNSPDERPENVGKVIHILPKIDSAVGSAIDGADNVEFTDTYHFGAPTHPKTLEILTQELAAISLRVPVVMPPAPPPAREEAPTPRPLKPAPGDAARDEWDFLKPDALSGGQAGHSVMLDTAPADAPKAVQQTPEEKVPAKAPSAN